MNTPCDEKFDFFSEPVKLFTFSPPGWASRYKSNKTSPSKMIKNEKHRAMNNSCTVQDIDSQDGHD